MILLTSTSDLLRVVTGSATNIDAHATWVDISGTTVTPGRTNTLITTATTTTVVGSPAASTYRTVKTLAVRNRGGTASVVTLVHSDGTTVPELISVSLSAGYCLHYDEGNGFTYRDASGRIIRRIQNTVPAVNRDYTRVTLTADVTNNNATANTIADVTGLSVAVTSGSTYWFRFIIGYTAAATTTGSRWSVNGPASPTLLIYRSEYSLTTTTRTLNEGLSTYDVPAASSASSAATGSNIALIEGIITPSANGTLIARFASEVSSSAIVAKAGSCLFYALVI